MNKIILNNNKLTKELDQNIVVVENGKMERFGIDEFSIYVHDNSDLLIIIEDDIKVSFNINLDNNVSLNLYCHCHLLYFLIQILL